MRWGRRRERIGVLALAAVLVAMAAFAAYQASWEISNTRRSRVSSSRT